MRRALLLTLVFAFSAAHAQPTTSGMAAPGTAPALTVQPVYVLRADGSVISNQGSFFSSSLNGARLMPGDAIVVPEDLTRTTWMKDLKDWTQIFYQFGLGAAAIKVIRD